MDFEIRWTAAAADDLESIITYAAGIDPQAAEKLAKTIIDHIEVLRTFPRIGPRYKKASRGEIREILCGKYRVFYRLNERSRYVEILTILHGAREEPEFSGNGR
jgi:plasmid stabilization system protein ParE